MDLNKVMIIGRLARDPELRTIPSGSSVANFSVATNRVYKDKSGTKQELVEFHDIVTWQRLAEIASQYLRRGSKVYIEGRLQTRNWDDPNGFKRYKTEIVAENLIMLDRPTGASGGSAPAQQNVNAGPKSYAPAPSSPAPRSAAGDQGSDNPPVMEEDLPTIDVSDEADSSAEVSVEDIPF